MWASRSRPVSSSCRPPLPHTAPGCRPVCSGGPWASSADSMPWVGEGRLQPLPWKILPNSRVCGSRGPRRGRWACSCDPPGTGRAWPPARPCLRWTCQPQGCPAVEFRSRLCPQTWDSRESPGFPVSPFPRVVVGKKQGGPQRAWRTQYAFTPMPFSPDSLLPEH